MVCVLDQKKHPLMPCSPRQARLLLQRGRAFVHRVTPLTMWLKDRRVHDFILQALALTIDPARKASGMAVARVVNTEKGEIFLCRVRHRGHEGHEHKVRQRNARRCRRSTNLRYRAPRFANCRKKCRWLPPSLLSSAGHILTWTRRLARVAPLLRIEVERVRLNMQVHQHPEIAGQNTSVEPLPGGKHGRIARKSIPLRQKAIRRLPSVGTRSPHIHSRTQRQSTQQDSRSSSPCEAVVCLSAYGQVGEHGGTVLGLVSRKPMLLAHSASETWWV
jgi:hypothetical protein